MMAQTGDVLRKLTSVHPRDGDARLSEIELRRSQSLVILLLLLIGVTLVVMVMDIAAGAWDFVAITIIGFFVLGGLYLFARRNHRWPRYVLLAFMALIVPYGFQDSIDTPIAVAFALPVVVVPLIASFWVVLPVTLLEFSWLLYLGMPFDWMLVVIFVVVTAVSALSTFNFEYAIQTVRQAVGMLAQTNEELEHGRALLESRAQDLARHVRYLEVTEQVASEAASQLELETLLARVVTLITEQFALYHTNIFLLDLREELVELRAASGDVGRQLLSQGHQVRVAADNLVSRAIRQGEAVTSEPELDLLEAEVALALPLQARGHTLGALVVYGQTSDAFDEEMTNVLDILAHQVAVAIDNVRLLAEAREAAQAERRAYGAADREAWARLFKEQSDFGYLSTEGGVFQDNEVWYAEMTRAIQQGAVVKVDEADAKGRVPVAVPIKTSAGQVIGVIDTYRPSGESAWSEDDLLLLETLSEQLGAALESANFYRETRRRETRERLLREVTARVRSSTDPETVLRTLLREVGTVLGRSAFVRLGSAEELRGSSSEVDRSESDV